MRKDYKPCSASSDTAADADLEFVRQYWSTNFDKDAMTDEKVKRVAHLEEYACMKPFLDAMPAAAAIFDGGCGLGEWCRFLGAQGYRMTGVDISESCIQRLNEIDTPCTFRVDDLRSLADADDTYDAYFSWGAFEHFEIGLSPCLTEAWRVLKPGGYLFLTVPQDSKRLRWDHPMRTYEASGIYHRQQGFQQRLRFYQWRFTPDELRLELERHGFQCEGIHPIQKYYGARRFVANQLGIVPDAVLGKILRRMVCALLPARWLGHMLMGIGRKRPERPQAAD